MKGLDRTEFHIFLEFYQFIGFYLDKRFGCDLVLILPQLLESAV